MQHIRRVFKKDLQFGFHNKHYKLRPDLSKLTCDACGEVFETKEAITTHYAMTNVPGFWKGTDRTPPQLNRPLNQCSPRCFCRTFSQR